MELRKERVTPKKAAEWLQRNVNNRPLSQTNVGKYAAAMSAGEWQLNGDPIRFNGNGDLIDGQHRLTAIVKSGVAIESVVIRGLEHSAFDTIDRGNKRTLSHILARRKEKSYVTLASAIRFLWKLNGVFTKVKGEIRPAIADKLLNDNPKLRGSVDFARQYCAIDALMSFGLCAALHHAFCQVGEESSTDFWTKVLVGEGITRSMPEYILRRTLLENKSSTAKLRVETIAAFAIKAWNARVTGSPLKILKWDPREAFPAIRLK